jgi:hypothetical protein
VLLRFASAMEDAAAHLQGALSDAVFARVAAQIPADWLAEEGGPDEGESLRAAYVSWLRARRLALPLILEEAARAHALSL